MEALQGQSQAQIQSLGQHIDFHMFVKNLEINCQKKVINRRNKLFFKKKQKQNWLYKTKIIPPSFPRFTPPKPSTVINNKNLQQCNTLSPARQPATSYENHIPSIRQTADAQIDKTKLKNLSKTSQVRFRNIVSCDLIKSNWKLAFRKDQLNIFRYLKIAKNITKESLDDVKSSNKIFKISNPLKRYDQSRAQIHRLYKTNLCLLNQNQKSVLRRQRLQTQSGLLNNSKKCLL